MTSASDKEGLSAAANQQGSSQEGTAETTLKVESVEAVMVQGQAEGNQNGDTYKVARQSFSQIEGEFSDNPPIANLLTSRRFGPLFGAQFFSAFNDNFLKFTLALVVTATVSQASSESLNTLGAAIFMLPFLLFSATGGELADRFDKARLARFYKLIEIFVAVGAALGLILGSIPILMVALFMFGVGSALFGPIKYAVLPEQIARTDLPKANGWVEAATFIAILLGSLLADYSFAGHHGPSYLTAILIVAFALLGWVCCCFMPYHGAAKADLKIDKNIIRTTGRLLHEISRERKLFIVSLMISWFWLVGAVLVPMIPAFGKQLGQFAHSSSFFLAVFAISIAIGSAMAVWASAGRIVLLQSVFGSIVCAIALLDAGFNVKSMGTDQIVHTYGEFLMVPGTIRLMIDLAFTAIGGAFLVVPGFAALQAWSAPQSRARVIAANNVLNSGIMVIGALVIAFVQSGKVFSVQLFSGASLHSVLIGLSIASFIASFFMLRYLPTNPFRDFITILFRAFFRLEVKGLENLKNAGETPILALNHVSFLDGLLALAITDNTMRAPAFAINSVIARRWWIRPFLKYMNAFPMDPTRPLAARSLIRAVKNGSPLVIFPEGRITVTGSLMKVYDGAAMVADRTNAKVVPIKIDGLERTFFSRLSGIAVRRQFFPKVRVTITAPVELELDPKLKSRARRHAAGNELYRIMSDLVFATSGHNGTVLDALVKAGKDYGMSHDAIEDPMRGLMSYGRMLTAIRALAKPLAKHLAKDSNVGLMMPNSNAAAITFFALQSAGKVPAMMNFSAGLSTLTYATTAAEIKTIVTSRVFLRQARLEELAESLKAANIRFVFLEDMAKEINYLAKITAMVMKTRPLVKNRQHHDPAAILYTSGSEGTPKGVVLSHGNMLSNVAQAAARVDFNSADRLFNVLPMFHSFGLTAGTVLPLTSGVPVYFYPSPLHYRIIPEAIYSSNATIIFGTDTFLNGYGRNAHPYDFRSIRYCFAGAEPVKSTTREMMMNKFGIRVLEGYGVTETSPVLALNTPMYNKPGTVGKLLPAITPRLEAVEGVDNGGRLFVYGPNVMAGYLRVEKPGIIEPPVDGWHDTGDIVNIDDEGFVTILGRAKRFAKVGGEMVSLSAVEAMASRAFPGVMLGVVTLSDPKKGERIVLISEEEQVNRPDLLKLARAEGIPELFVPSRIIYGKLPLLGTGKIDYPALKKQVEEA
ncbi:acyl-[ACP]--phospholipid O-acyltransferase [Bartonella sp. HY761]|uniref:acyl-[ACP]--phospholipid O-acyltransferase n=1 Tax=Bartonella sp. HY761 TaxID=2979330 RepID=UPI00220DFA93|nr:acyl-[ACP]--phospholipid O-acyltransferase [Bartonella sp. HY761]UXN06727.1 acyl-[ACP]--phospholipid O-acyltransferase [Bartonella sp. HY761]